MRVLALLCAVCGVASEAVNLTPDNFEKEVTNSGKSAFIKFLAPWCVATCTLGAPARASVCPVTHTLTTKRRVLSQVRPLQVDEASLGPTRF